VDVTHRFAPLARQGSIPCPFCGGAIAVDPVEVLRGDEVACTHCGATLTVDRAASGAALDALARAMAAVRTSPPAEGEPAGRGRRRPRRKMP
jgi:hypothetical protein